jgi:hypothetical protein
MNNKITQAELKEEVNYDSETGLFTWNKRKFGVTLGMGAGSINDGYLCIKVKGKSYKAHRLAWLYETGAWPKEQIDHIDGNRLNNKICNLREARLIDNAKNRCVSRTSKTGIRGVWWNKIRQRYEAYISHNKKRTRII